MKTSKQKKILSLLLIMSVFATPLQNTGITATSKTIKLSQKKLSLYVGKAKTLKLKGATVSKVKWTSTAKKIASVANGKVKGKKAGTCYIIAKYNKKSYRCKVSVKEKTTLTDQNVQQTQTPATVAPTPNNRQTAVGVDFTIQKYDAQSMTLSLQLTNHSGKTITLDDAFVIQKYENEKWTDLPSKNNTFKAIAMLVEDGKTTNLEVNVGTYYDALANGKYRIVKNIGSAESVYAEFTVTTGNEASTPSPSSVVPTNQPTSEQQNKNTSMNTKTVSEVSFSLISNTKTSIQLSINNNTEFMMTYGESYYLEKFEKDTWIPVPFVTQTPMFEAIAMVIDKDANTSWGTNWEKIYGTLEQGKYRITKDFYANDNCYKATCEFSIED